MIHSALMQSQASIHVVLKMDRIVENEESFMNLASDYGTDRDWASHLPRSCTF